MRAAVVENLDLVIGVTNHDDRLVADLRLHGLTSVLQSKAPPVTRTGLDRARTTFLETAGDDGRVIETFEILTLSGWRR